MADPRKSVAENVAGDFFVDTTCIDCDACRQIAPSVFAEASSTSFVRRQPATLDDRRNAIRALLSCPTGSIGCRGNDNVKAVMQDFPLAVEEPVFYCGYNSPKFVPALVRRLEDLGGVAHIFLTHRDDVADARRFAEHFGSRRVIHRDELDSQPEAEFVIDGAGPWELAPGYVAIATPGHTQGHIVLLVRNRFLFTGDHLDWDRSAERLAASENYCWYSWPEQSDSMERLSRYDFEWVLPGHGQKVHLPAAEMKGQMTSLVARMRQRQV